MEPASHLQSEKAEATILANPDEWGRRLAEDVDAVLKRFPEADADAVRLTLINLESSPLDRLNRSLRRGRGFAAFRR